MTGGFAKIVYVLCADKAEYLYLLAANTVLTKQAAPGSSVACLIDRQTEVLARTAGFRFEDWSDELIVVDAPHASPLVNSRYLKTKMRGQVRGDFLFLDLDAVVVREELFQHLGVLCLGASQNLDHLDRTANFPVAIGRTIYEPMGWEHPFLPYVNSGVLFCRDNANCHALFQRRHELWESQRRKLGIHLDQPSLNRALWETPGGLTQMPPEFNSPVDVGPAFEAGAWVYHYYISVYAGKPRNDSVLGIVSQEIRRRGRIHPSLLRALSASKRAFYAEAHDIRHALQQRWWRRAGNLWFDTLREIPTRKSAWRSLLLLGPRAGCVSGNTAAFWQQALVGNTETGPRKTGTR